MTDVLETTLKPSPDALSNAVGRETVLLHVKQGTYYGLDEVGTRLWAGIRDGVPLSEVCKSMSEQFGVPLDKVKDDARAFVELLKQNEIVLAD